MSQPSPTRQSGARGSFMRSLLAATLSRRSANGEVGRVRDLEVLERAGDELRPQADRLDAHASSVTSRRLRASASAKNAEAEHLRRLRLPDVVARSSVAATRSPSACFSVSADRQREQAAEPVVAAGIDQRARSIRCAPGSARRRARAPSRRRSRRARPARRGRSRRCAPRVVPPQRASARRADRPASRARRSKCVVVGRDHDEDPAAAAAPRPAPPACGRPAAGRRSSTYCLAIGPRRRARRCRRTGRARTGGGCWEAGVGIGARSIDRERAPKDKPQAPRRTRARSLKSLLCFTRHATSCRLHAAPRHRPRQALRAAPARPARPMPCCSPASPRRERARGKRRRDRHRRARRRAAPRRRAAVLRARRCASPSSPTGKRCPTTPSRRTRT